MKLKYFPLPMRKLMLSDLIPNGMISLVEFFSLLIFDLTKLNFRLSNSRNFKRPFAEKRPRMSNLFWVPLPFVGAFDGRFFSTIAEKGAKYAPIKRTKRTDTKRTDISNVRKEPSLPMTVFAFRGRFCLPLSVGLYRAWAL